MSRLNAAGRPARVPATHVSRIGAMSDEKLTVLVTGATGFIGRRLVRALVADGHTVKAMTRRPALRAAGRTVKAVPGRPDDSAGPGEPVFGDVFDAGTLASAMEGVDAAV